MMSVRCTSPPISVLEVTELIVRELRLRTFSAAVGADGPRPDPAANDVRGIESRVVAEPPMKRLVLRYSRRRRRPGQLEL
jgi:hypothetical protein